MKRKKITALLMSAVLGMAMLAGCGKTSSVQESTEEVQETEKTQTEEVTQAENTNEEESGDPLSEITKGYYTYGYEVGDMLMSYYLHFYEEQPVLGSVFYAGMCMNQINFAGTYKVAEEAYDYSCAATRADQESGTMTEGTAPYTVYFYDWDGNELDKCGFDGENLYNNMTAITGVGGENVILAHDTDIENSKYADTYAAEAGQIYASYVSEEDATSTLALYHNGRYLDMVDMMVEGSWTMAETGEGYEFTLTPDMDSDTAAVLDVTADFSTASYTPDGGTAVALVNNKEAGPEVSYTLTGTIAIPGQDGVEADLVGKLYADGTVTLTASAFGTDMDVDAGTYTVNESYVYTFEFDNAGELTSTFGDAGAVLNYTQAGHEIFGDIEEVLVIGLPE